MIDIPCVILAGGKSSRMEEDKCFLPFKNTTLIKYQYDRLSKIFSNVYISSKVNKFDFDCELILENSEIYSPLIALDNILNNLNSNVFIISVDTPLISLNSIEKIINSSKDFDITIAQTKDEKRHNLTGVFTINIKNKIKTMLSEDFHKIGYLIKNTNSNIVCDFCNGEFINLNTKEDYINILNKKE